MEKRIITISREFGSGGRTIGKLVAEHLGIRCYDAELIQKLAVESGFDENYVKEAGEYTPGGFLASAFTDRSFGPTNEDLLWKLQYRIIRELAEKEPCVIVGRCADFILQDRTDCLKVFVHADQNAAPTTPPCFSRWLRSSSLLFKSSSARKRKTSTQCVLVFLGAVKQSKSEPFPSDATSVASPKVTVCVPSL